MDQDIIFLIDVSDNIDETETLDNFMNDVCKLKNVPNTDTKPQLYTLFEDAAENENM